MYSHLDPIASLIATLDELPMENVDRTCERVGYSTVLVEMTRELQWTVSCCCRSLSLLFRCRTTSYY